MAGCFGLLDHPQDNRVPASRLVENTPTICVFQTARQHRIRAGDQVQIALPVGYPTGLGPASESEAKSQTITIGQHDEPGIVAARIYFQCPSCSRACYRLHFTDDAWRCRLCARLTYASQHRNRTLRGYNRINYLRRRLEAAPARRSRRLRLKLLLELGDLEEGLRAYFRRINDVLEARENARRRKAKENERGS